MMKADNIVKAYNESLEALAESKKLFNKANKELLGEIFGTVMYGLNQLTENSSYNHKQLQEGYGVLKNYIQKNYNLIKESI